MYDAVTRVPLIVWSPRRVSAGQSVEGLQQQMDLAPTTLELAGLEPPSHWEARSLLPALRGEDDAGRKYVFAEQARDGNLTGTTMMTIVRGREWKLVHCLGQPDGELYDLRADPGERHNLWFSADHAGSRGHSLAILRDWLISSNLRTGDWTARWR